MVHNKNTQDVGHKIVLKIYFLIESSFLRLLSNTSILCLPAFLTQNSDAFQKKKYIISCTGSLWVVRKRDRSFEKLIRFFNIYKQNFTQWYLLEVLHLLGFTSKKETLCIFKYLKLMQSCHIQIQSISIVIESRRIPLQSISIIIGL